jgi:hypothetical protein
MDVMAKTAPRATVDQPDPPTTPSPTSAATRKPDWFPDWTGATSAIVASGPSAVRQPFHLLQERRHIKVAAVNTSFQLVPWADMLYACDAKWWEVYKGAPDFKGLKVTYEKEAVAKYPELKRVDVARFGNELLLATPGLVGAGGNSGFQCLNLHVQFGVKRILLIGFDMRLESGCHWHPRHPYPLSNPDACSNIPRWRKSLDGAAKKLAENGVQVINCSMLSDLRAYPKMSLEKALELP